MVWGYPTASEWGQFPKFRIQKFIRIGFRSLGIGAEGEGGFGSLRESGTRGLWH